jgi:hypothetical protein
MQEYGGHCHSERPIIAIASAAPFIHDALILNPLTSHRGILMARVNILTPSFIQ